MGLTVRVEGGTNAGKRRPLAGPAEEWFCDCRDHRGNAVLRPASWRNCGVCRAERPSG